MPGGQHYTAALPTFPFLLKTANLFPFVETTKLTDAALAFESRKIMHP